MFYKYVNISIPLKSAEQVFRFQLSPKRDEKINEEIANFLSGDGVSMFCLGTLWNDTALVQVLKPTAWRVGQKKIIYTTDPSVAILFKLKFLSVIKKIQTSTESKRYVRDMEWITMS